MNDPRKGADAEPTTHFGYQNVPESQKAKKVAEVFHSVAAKYDLMNDLMSGGIHRLWKRFTIELSGVRSGNRVLDIAGGTGDLTRQFSRLVGPTGEVVLADINASMLKVGRDKLLDKGVSGNVSFVQADAEKLPFPDNHFDCVTIAFGLRNVTHKDEAIRSMQARWPPAGAGVLQAEQQPAVQGLRRLFVQPAAADGQAGHQRLRELSLPGRVDPHAPRPGNPEGDDGGSRLRPRDLPQHDRRHRRPAPRYQALTEGAPMSSLLIQAVLAAAETGINRVLRLDGTALPRLRRLSAKVIEVDCLSPPLRVFILPAGDGLHFAGQHEAEVDCTLRAPAGNLLHLALARDKTRVLHSPEVSMDGDSAALLELAGILQSLELDWEYELSRWLGPLATQVLGSGLRDASRWSAQSLHSLRLNLADYLAEESRTLVGQHEAEARFAELDQLKLALDRLDARVGRLSQKTKPDA